MGIHTPSAPGRAPRLRRWLPLTLGLAACHPGPPEAPPPVADRASALRFANLNKLAVGGAHSLLAMDNGLVLGWGRNSNHQLGDGSTTDRAVPKYVPVSFASGVAAGAAHSLVVMTNQRVLGWGLNSLGQVGSNARARPEESFPTEVISWAGTPLQYISAIAAGEHHSLALSTNGVVYAWGEAQHAAVGATPDGACGGAPPTENVYAARPVAMPESCTINNAIAIAAGFHHSLALLSDHTVVAWGENNAGQLGSNSTGQRRATPERVQLERPAGATSGPPLSNIVAIAAGEDFSMALAADGALYTWGSNSYWTLGESANSRSYAKSVPLPAGLRPTALGAGRHVGYLTDGDQVYTWGDHTKNQLGHPLGVNVNDVIKPALLSAAGTRRPVLAISTGAAAEHTLVGWDDRSLWAMGDNASGQLGVEDTQTWTTPKRTALPLFRSVAAGEFHSLAVRTDGTLLAWGDNRESQVSSARSYENTPIKVSGLQDVVQVAAGTEHSLALSADGTLYGFGNNHNYQLGAGSQGHSATPLRISGGVTAMAAGARHSLALLADRTVSSFGTNDQGQLGDPAVTLWRKRPGAVPNLDKIVAVAAGAAFSMALRASGDLYVWGDNSASQLGIAGVASADTPRLLLSNVVRIAAGRDFALAWLEDGTLMGWGHNDYFQLSHLFGTIIPTPKALTAAPDLAWLSAGGTHGVLVRTNGSGAVFGDNTSGQYGGGYTGFINRWFQPTVRYIDLVSTASGGYHILGLTPEGAVYAWGRNPWGALGDGTNTDRWDPVLLVPY